MLVAKLDVPSLQAGRSASRVKRHKKKMEAEGIEPPTFSSHAISDANETR